MAIEKAYVVPHPPLIIPNVGRGEEKTIQKTIDAYHHVAEEIGKIKPDTVIITSPHAPMYADYFHMSPGKAGRGSFASFGAPQVSFEVTYNRHLAKGIIDWAEHLDIHAGFMGEREKTLDHGVMVPLYFIEQYLSDFQVIRIGLSGMSFKKHFRFGKAIHAAVDEAGNRVVFVSSGDLSHRLKEDGPYGYVKEGPEFDERVVELLKNGDLSSLKSMDQTLVERAGECGLRSFIIMAGALEDADVTPAFHSYEGPFGVGYAVAGFTPRHLDS